MTLSIRQIMTDEELYHFCRENSDHKFEREPDGRIVVISNTGGKTGIRNSGLTADVLIWNETNYSGEVFGSLTAFRLPDGSTRSPDVAWISHARWHTLTDKEQERFPPICPDFVIELRSPSDSLSNTKKKMTDVWMANGCRLAWLIGPTAQKIHIFRANGEIQIIQGFDKPLSGKDVLEGFTMVLK